MADSLDEAKGRSGRPADWELADAGFRAWLESNIPGKLRRTGTLPLLSDITVRNNSPAARTSKRDGIEPRQIPFLAPGLFISQTGLI